LKHGRAFAFAIALSIITFPCNTNHLARSNLYIEPFES
jgi:hypothetical protein